MLAHKPIVDVCRHYGFLYELANGLEGAAKFAIKYL